MKLNKNAFAKALAALSLLFVAVFYLLQLVMPAAFVFLFNAQFFGADIASLLPGQLSLGDFIEILVTLGILGWIMGWLWASLYNRFV